MGKQEEVTVTPRLRFPEFKASANWSLGRLGTLFYERQEVGYAHLPLLSLMDKEGIVPQEESNRKNNSSSDKSKYLRVVPGDIAYNTMRMWEGRSAYAELEGLISPAYTVCAPLSGTDSRFFSYYFKTGPLVGQFRKYSQGLVKDTLNLKYENFSRIEIAYPCEKGEQKKITDCLMSLDEVIAAQGRKVEALKAYKRGLMQQLYPRGGETRPRLRFRKFRNAAEWKGATVRTLISTITPPRKIPTSGYGAEGLLPIIDQSPDPICGWTNDLEAKVDARCPLIIFGDHTCVLKLVEHDFAQGADGIKIISARPHIDTRFLYFGLQADPLASASYRRHFSLLQEKRIAFPEGLKEQQHIADCLSSLDTQIAAGSAQLSALKTHKQSLMQQLFPAPEAASA